MSNLFDKEARSYRSKQKIRAIKYQKGMENGYILRFYEEECPSHLGAIICNSLEQASEEMKKPTREKLCWKADNSFVPVIYEQPVPIIITHKYTDEENELLSEAGYLLFTPLLDDNENDYAFSEITEENCWIVEDLLRGGISTESDEFMQEYEVLEDNKDIPQLNTSPLGSDVIHETFWQKEDKEE